MIIVAINKEENKQKEMCRFGIKQEGSGLSANTNGLIGGPIS